ncbi:MAG: TIGR03545 family protein [Candidatus Cloacimonetes bacterium]|nr:TIGR03545 family protein [Candidatus Cloacimonadota bacterium]
MKYLRIISLIFLIIILLIFGIYLFRNQIITSVIEKNGTKLNRAKVDLTDFNNPIFTTRIEWENLEITNPERTRRNIVETGPCKFELQFKPLLAGKFIIVTIELGHIKTNTKRETNGKIEFPPKEEKEKSRLVKTLKNKLQEEKKNIPILNPKQLKTDINTDKILSELDFRTPQKADSIEKYVKDRAEFWQDRFDNNNYEERTNRIQTDIRKININQIEEKKDNALELIKEIDNQLTTLNKVKKNSREIYNQIENDKNSLQSDLKNFRKLKDEISESVKADYQNALDLAELPHTKIENVARMLFGKNLTTILMQIVEKMEAAKQIEKIEPEPKKEKMSHLPKFWIKKIYIKGELPNKNIIEGNITHVSSDQDKTGMPISADIEAFFSQNTTLDIEAILDFRNDKKFEKITINADKIYIKDTKFFDFALLPQKINRAEASITSETMLSKSKFISKNNFNFQDLEFNLNTKPTDLSKDLKQVSDQLISSLHAFNLNFTTSYENEEFDYIITSNLGQKIRKEIEIIVNSKFAEAQNRLKREVDKRLEPYEKKVQTLINSKIRTLNKKLENLTGSSKYNLNEINNLEQELKDLKQKKLDEYEEEAKKKGGDVLEKLKDKFDW